MFPSVSLPTAFWLFGVIGTPIIFFLSRLFGKFFGPAGLHVFALIVGFYLLWVVGLIWKAGASFEGSRVWPITAKCISTGIASIFIITCGVGFYFFRLDPFNTSFTVMSSVTRHQSHPMIGFFKVNCSDNFGLVVEKATETEYFVRFCGPGGCFGKGPMSRTSFKDHILYSIVDQDTIGISGVKFPGMSELSKEEAWEIRNATKDGKLIFKRCQ